MRVLAFDTCFDAVSAAAGVRDATGHWCKAERFEAIGKGHAEKLLPMIREVMQDARLSFDELDKIAVTNGPGGFTGLRAGLAAARGLALASGKPLVAIGSLELMALAVSREAAVMAASLPLIVVADARKGDVFFQAFRSVADPVATAGAVLASVEAAAAMLPAGGCILAGSGARAVATTAGGRRDIRIIDSVSAHARDLMVTAAELEAGGPVTPVYLRAPDAKPQQSQQIARSGA